MKGTRNPYRAGGACYLAYEAGYMQALTDAMQMMEENSYGEKDHEAGNAAGVPGPDEKDPERVQ